ncbi:Hypothetical protein SMAX5B_009840 [Scophthalmus maximus]|uniref:Uncharacterized protein n=1 Tax=Scophthalmus maximus TaxID=52904 RepID=A0A2U9BZ69_SCOMX|nr:Hypothetical protein SMAX5B_009840 [Scophthalmus maximus]
MGELLAEAMERCGDTRGTPRTAWIGTVRQFWDSSSCLPWLLQTAPTGSIMARTKERVG